MNVKATPAQFGAAAPTAPILAAAAGILSYSLMDATMKRAGQIAGVYDALLVRSIIGAVLLTPIWLLTRPAAPSRHALRMHAARGVVSAGVSVTFFWGLARTPIAEAIALSFIAPVIALWLAAAILGERLRPPAIAAAVLGLAGVAVITLGRLHSGATDHSAHHDATWGIASILCSAVLYAVNLIMQRRQAQVSAPLEVAFFQMIVVGLTLAAAWPWVGTPVPRESLGWIAASTVLATASLMALAWGWARAEAQVLIPMEYTAFVWAAGTGWFFFAEPLTGPTLAGVALILTGCWAGTRGGGSADPATEHIEQMVL